MKKTLLVLSKTKFQKEKEEREARLKQHDAEAAAVYQTFAASFAPERPANSTAGGGMTFVRGGVIQKGAAAVEGSAGTAAAAAVGTEYRMQAAVVAAVPLPITAAAAASLAPKKAPREMDLLMEELKNSRDGRHAPGTLASSSASRDGGSSGGGGGSVPSFSTRSLGPGGSDPQTTNLLISNLAPTATEEELTERFTRYGRIASVKVMWPRTDEERARGRNTGFVMFYDRGEAEAAMAALQDCDLNGQRIFISWGKMPAGGIRAPPPLPSLTPAASAPAPQPPSSSSPLLANESPVSPLPPPSSAVFIPGANLRDQAAALIASLALRSEQPAPTAASTPAFNLASAVAPPLGSSSAFSASSPSSSQMPTPPAPPSFASSVTGAAGNALSAHHSAAAAAAAPPPPQSAASTAAAAADAAALAGRRVLQLCGRRVVSGWDDETPPSTALRDSLLASSTYAFGAMAPGAECVSIWPPRDAFRRNLIDCVSEFIAKDGQALESLLQARLLNSDDNRDYEWIASDADGPDAQYYRWRVFSLLQGGTLSAWRTLPFQMQLGGAWVKPPPCPLPPASAEEDDAADAEAEAELRENERRARVQASEAARRGRDNEQTSQQATAVPKAPAAVEAGTLRERYREELSELLAGAHLGRAFVRRGMAFAMDHADAARHVVAALTSFFGDGSGVPAVAQVSVLYLISDILHNSSAPVRNASVYRSALQIVLPECFEALGTCLRRLTGRMTSRAMQERVLRVLAFWERISVFAPLYIAGLEATLVRKTAVSGGSDAAVDGLPVDEVLRKARAAGLSVEGGAPAAVQRLAWLQEYTRLKAGLSIGSGGGESTSAAAVATASGFGGASRALPRGAADGGTSSSPASSLMALITAKPVFVTGAPVLLLSAPVTTSTTATSAWAELVPDYHSDDDDGDIDGVPLESAPPVAAAAAPAARVQFQPQRAPAAVAAAPVRVADAGDNDDDDIDGVPLDAAAAGAAVAAPPATAAGALSAALSAGVRRGRWDRDEEEGDPEYNDCEGDLQNGEKSSGGVNATSSKRGRWE